MRTRTQIVGRARLHVGHREVTPNRSILIDAWVRRCGLDPAGGYPWCAAFASWCVEDYRPVADPDVDYPVACAGALRLGRAFPETRNPQPGDLMWFATDGKGAGHIGIVVAGVGLDEVLCVEGNSDNRVRFTRRARAEVRFSSTRPSEALALPALPEIASAAPLVRVAREGTR